MIVDTRTQYAWVIERDHLDKPGKDPHTAKGLTGPSAAPQELLDRLERGQGVRFRMYDGDGELYFTGRVLALNEDGTTQAFKDAGDEFMAPLDDFGGPDSGCVEIRYRNTETREWESL